jgi:hypothetical protein
MDPEQGSRKELKPIVCSLAVNTYKYVILTIGLGSVAPGEWANVFLNTGLEKWVLTGINWLKTKFEPRLWCW